MQVETIFIRTEQYMHSHTGLPTHPNWQDIHVCRLTDKEMERLNGLCCRVVVVIYYNCEYYDFDDYQQDSQAEKYCIFIIKTSPVFITKTSPLMLWRNIIAAGCDNCT